jgi:hypothetical protein
MSLWIWKSVWMWISGKLRLVKMPPAILARNPAPHARKGRAGGLGVAEGATVPQVLTCSCEDFVFPENHRILAATGGAVVARVSKPVQESAKPIQKT